MKIITFDGYQGAGKTTQIRLLKGKFGKDYVFLEWYYWSLLLRYNYYDLVGCLDDFFGDHLEYIGYKPSLSFWIDMPFAIARDRASKRSIDVIPFDILPYELNYDTEVAERLPILKKTLPNFHVLDGLQTPDIIHKEIMGFVVPCLFE